MSAEDQVTPASQEPVGEDVEWNDEEKDQQTRPRSGGDWSKVVVFGILPAVTLVLAGVAGFLKWQDSSRREAENAAIESVAAAREATTAILSYQSESAERDLDGARNLLTGSFLDTYTKLINDVVIPGAKEKKISSVAKVPAASSVSASANHAVALVFVDQTVTVGNSAPTDSASSVRVTLDKVSGKWLISGFDPV